MKKSKNLKKAKKASKPIRTVKFIQASEAKPKTVYLTKLGICVLVKKVSNNGVQIVPEFSSKTLIMKKSDPLFFCPKKRIRRKAQIHFKACLDQWKKQALSGTEELAIPQDEPTQSLPVTETHSATQARRGPKGPRSTSVSSIVDPMLLGGSFTRPEICVILGQSEIGATLRNRDMGWYVGYRIAVLKERGFLFEQNESGIIKMSKIELTPKPSLSTLEKIREKMGI